MRRSLPALIRGLRGRVAVTCFASNVARVEIDRARRAAMPAAAWPWSAAACATWTRRRANAATCTTCRSSCREDDADDIPDDNLLILITGSQGEPRSRAGAHRDGHASAHRAGRGRHRDLLAAA